MTWNIQHFTGNGLGMSWDWARNITANSHCFFSARNIGNTPRNVLGGSARNQWLRVKPSYNDKIHSSTNHTPFFLNYRRHLWKGEIQTSKGTNPTAEDFVHALEIAQEEAAAAMTQAAEKAKSHYDLQRQSARAYKPNNLIWLEPTNLKEVWPSKKLSAKHYGPFKILAKSRRISLLD
jgi:hypothetical protein